MYSRYVVAFSLVKILFEKTRLCLVPMMAFGNGFGLWIYPLFTQLRVPSR